MRKRKAYNGITICNTARWDDLWLNEGFARFMEHLGADQIKPEWRMFDNLFDVILGVIQSDSRDTVRPIWLTTTTVDDINSNYDGTITYGKVKQALFFLFLPH